MVFFKKIVSKHYNMTTTPKKRLIILILGITTHLNLGNIPQVFANQADHYSKNFLLKQIYASKLTFIYSVQQNFILEKNLFINYYFIKKNAIEIDFLNKSTAFTKTTNFNSKSAIIFKNDAIDFN